MPSSAAKKNDTIVVSALSARSNFGKLLRRIDLEHRSLVIEKRGTPAAVLMGIRDYVKLAAPEPEVLRIIGEEAKLSRSNTLTTHQIDQVIKATRADKKRR
jgi:prevent-host-death family protein